MNYRHAYHAGNFADVFKHAVIARIIAHLREKPAAFRVIDTHAGAGAYDLTGPEASRTGEWRNGIGRLLSAPLEPELASWLSPYLDVIGRLNPNGLKTYPGSPLLAQQLLRPLDNLLACEIEPQAAASLSACLRPNTRTKILTIDGWTALNAYVPPRERRGLVLVDPPFEQPGEFARLSDGLARAHRKWSTGVYVLWYPLKDLRETNRFGRDLAGLGIAKILRAELSVAEPKREGALAGAGLIVANPPWPLAAELEHFLTPLAAAMESTLARPARIEWLAGEAQS